MTGLLLDNIGSLVTNDPGIGQGPLGLVRDAAVIFEGGIVAWAGPRSKVPGGGTDTRVDAEGRAVIPGFVDSHAHLVFADDRTAEFAARMSGQQYSAGGIRTTVNATRAASADMLRSNAGRLVAEAHTAAESGDGLVPRDRAVRDAPENDGWQGQRSCQAAVAVV